MREARSKLEVLRARARALARPPAADGEQEVRLEVVEFALAGERYAVESRHVREVLSSRDLTPVPCTPPFVAGIVNVRGHILSVIDLKRVLELPIDETTGLRRVLVLSGCDTELGVLANAVLGMSAIPVLEIQASLPALAGVRRDLLVGVTPEGLVILDAAKLLADERIVVHEDVEE